MNRFCEGPCHVFTVDPECPEKKSQPIDKQLLQLVVMICSSVLLFTGTVQLFTMRKVTSTKSIKALNRPIMRC
jgi:hypothetical protein